MIAEKSISRRPTGLTSHKAFAVPAFCTFFQKPSRVSLRREGVLLSKQWNEVILFACEMALEANIIIKAVLERNGDPGTSPG